MDRHLQALRRLMLAGWIAIPIGDPHDPHALVYTHPIMPGTEDVIHVKAFDDALAFRRVRGDVIAVTEGTVADVVTAVLDWPSFLITT